MRPIHLASAFLCVVLAACGSGELVSVQSKMDVEIVNKSSRNLQNALVRFGDYNCKLGNVGQTFTAGYGFYPHPITPDAELHWDEDGRHRMEKIDLRKIYPPGKSGRLTFTVHDGRVEVGFREKAPEP